MTRVLFIGEIVGSGGVFCIKSRLKKLIQEQNADFVIANADGATGGFGIGKTHAVYLHKLGIDVLTGGDCVYFKKDMVTFFPKINFMLRAANYPYGNPGRGWRVLEKNGKKLAIISLLGQAGFNRVHLSNPFALLQELSAKIGKDCPHILVDFHAATTAEKATMFFHADGKVSAVIGTHMKVQTGDERVMKSGTAIITDAGRTGSLRSIGGLGIDTELRKIKTGIPERSNDAWDDLHLQGVVIDLDDNGKALSIKRINEFVEAPIDRNSESFET